MSSALAPTTTATTSGEVRRGAPLIDAALTTLAPMLWGTTYVVTATLLPPDRPLLAALLRALPAGLLLMAFHRRLPRGVWWWRTAILGTLNFGAFFPLVFYAAYHLPGGVAATIGAVQPLMVAGLSLMILKVSTPRAILLTALVGVGGVALLTLTSQARLDFLGVAAMIVGTALVGLAVVLTKHWGSPERPIVTVGWQLTVGGIILLPLTLAAEGLPPTLTPTNLLGYGYLATFGAIISYTLWFRGIGKLPATSVSLLSLSNPLVAAGIGFLILGQTLTPWQLAGFTVALSALATSQLIYSRRQLPGE